MEAAGLSVKRGRTVAEVDDYDYTKLKRPRDYCIRTFPSGLSSSSVVSLRLNATKSAAEYCILSAPAAQQEKFLLNSSEPRDMETVKESFSSSWRKGLYNCNTELAIRSQGMPNEPKLSKSTDVLKSHIGVESDYVNSLISDGGLLKLPSAMEFDTQADANGVPMCFRESCCQMPLDFTKLPDLLGNASPEKSSDNIKFDDVSMISSDAKSRKDVELLYLEKSLYSGRVDLLEIFGSTEPESEELPKAIDENSNQSCSYTTQMSDEINESESKKIQLWNSNRPADRMNELDNSIVASSEMTRTVVSNGNLPLSECQEEVTFSEQVGFSQLTGQPIATRGDSPLSQCKEKINFVEQSGSSGSLAQIIETKGDHPVSECMEQVTILEKAESLTASNLLSEFWSNLCNIQHEPLATSTQNQCRNSDASSKKASKEFLRRKFSAVRTFPSGCGPKNAPAKVDKGNESASTVKDKASLIINLKWGGSKPKTKPLQRKVLDNRLSSSLVDTKLVSRQVGRYIMGSKSRSEIPRNSECQRIAPSDEERPLSKKIKYINCLSDQRQFTDNDIVSRETVRETLRLFQAICRKLIQKEEINVASNDRNVTPNNGCYGKKGNVLGKGNRIDFMAFKLLKERGMFLAAGKQWLGHVPGIEVGDEFHYRVELCLTGLHRPPMAGIDFAKYNGTTLATCIVSSGGYSDIIDSSDILVYEGEGGHPGYQARKKHLPGNQKLERGNLALKNSMVAQTPVRVIHGYREQKANESHAAKMRSLATYVYDGLYLVEKYWSEMGSRGFSVYKFRLRRIPDQPHLALKEVLMLKQMKVRIGLCVEDISKGKEKNAICAVNTIDYDVPMPFTYTTRMVFSSSYKLRRPKGCGCVGGCKPETCACLAENGGEFPYNYDGAIVRAKPLVYECGPSCGCLSSCYNRVSQHGIKFPLEVFKTKSRGWGVRSLASIPSGSFICEYIGELLQDSEAEERANDEYLFDIGKNYTDQALWEGLSSFIPNSQKDSNYDGLDDAGFTIDAAKYGNVGRFINHSCSPNLYAQNVLYDHDAKRMPHIMLFAAENIPPLKELTYHYNYAIDQVHDMDGNIKKKACNCGSSGCTGWLY